MPISPLIVQTLEAIGPLNEAAMAAARARQDTLTKPPGSLGRLEEISILLASLSFTYGSSTTCSGCMLRW